MKGLEITNLNINPDINCGSIKELKYSITNKNHYMVRDLVVNAGTTNPNGEFTKKNYVTKITDHKTDLMPNESIIFYVKIEIPEDYNETYINKSNETVLSPLSVKIRVDGKQVIRER